MEATLSVTVTPATGQLLSQILQAIQEAVQAFLATPPLSLLEQGTARVIVVLCTGTMEIIPRGQALTPPAPFGFFLRLGPIGDFLSIIKIFYGI